MLASVSYLAAMAHAAGCCRVCAICGKPFTAARAPKAGGIYGDAKYPGQGVVYLLCRRCGRLPSAEKLERLACGAQDALLAAAHPKGSA